MDDLLLGQKIGSLEASVQEMRRTFEQGFEHLSEKIDRIDNATCQDRDETKKISLQVLDHETRIRAIEGKDVKNALSFIDKIKSRIVDVLVSTLTIGIIGFVCFLFLKYMEVKP